MFKDIVVLKLSPVYSQPLFDKRNMKIIGKVKKKFNTGLIQEIQDIKFGKVKAWEITLTSGDVFYSQPFKI